MAPPKKIANKSASAASPSPVAEETPVIDPATTTPDIATSDPVKSDPMDVVVEESAAQPDLAARIVLLQERMQTVVREFTTTIKELQTSLKLVLKDVQKQSRSGKRKAPTPAVGGEPKKPSGFAKPTLLSTELCDFLGVPAETKLARTDVTRMITKYIKENELYAGSDKRNIKPDIKVMKLLKIDENTALTYFNLQAHLKPHFIKEGPAASEISAA